MPVFLVEVEEDTFDSTDEVKAALLSIEGISKARWEHNGTIENYDYTIDYSITMGAG